jgi:hypothetical protein
MFSKKIKSEVIVKIFFVILFLLPTSVMASESLNYRIHHEYQSPRALGMGDAFVAVANDYSAIFYNPAGLARRDDGQINLYIGGGAAKDFYDFFKKADEAGKTQGTEAQKNEAILNVVNSVYGKHYFLNMTFPDGIWVRPGWGIAVIPLTATIDMSMHKQLGPSINTTIISDSIVAFSLARDFYWLEGSHISGGATFKFINRGFFDKQIAVIDLLADSKNIVKASDFSEGATVDADVGFLVTPEMPTEGFFSVMRLAKPTFGVVVKNIFDYGFTQDLNLYNKTKETEQPQKLYRRIDLGTRWEYPEFLIFGGRGVMDLRDILHPNFSAKRGLHLGFEFDWTMFSWWRGHYRVGFSQGYLTAGLSALFTWFNLDLVTYAEDVGTKNTPVESRKLEIRMNIDI